MSQMDVTWMRALKVFWSALWRVLIFAAIPATVLSIVTFDVPLESFVNAVELLQASRTLGAWLIFGMLAVVAVGVFLGTSLTKVVLGQAYSDFRIVLEGYPKRLKIEPRLEERDHGRRRSAPTVDAGAAAAAVRSLHPMAARSRQAID